MFARNSFRWPEVVPSWPCKLFRHKDPGSNFLGDCTMKPLRGDIYPLIPSFCDNRNFINAQENIAKAPRKLFFLASLESFPNLFYFELKLSEAFSLKGHENFSSWDKVCCFEKKFPHSDSGRYFTSQNYIFQNVFLIQTLTRLYE